MTEPKHGDAPLVVEETDPPDVDRDIVLIADDWRLDKAGKIDAKTMGSLFERAHAGRLGNNLTLNGLPLADLFLVRGNEWHENALKSRGYVLLRTVEARSEHEALETVLPRDRRGM